MAKEFTGPYNLAMRLLLLVVGVLVCGCGSPDESKVVGDWVSTFVSDDRTKTPGANLTIDKEHHWRELYRNAEFEGSWKLAGNTLNLRMETFGKLSIAD